MNLTPEICYNLFRHYALGEPQTWFRMTKGYSNANFKVTTPLGPCLLKIYLDEELGDIPYEVNLLLRLRELEFPAAYPIRDRNGNYIQETPLGRAVIYQFIEGEEPACTPATVAAVARAVAELNNFPDYAQFRKANLLDWGFCLKTAQRLADSSADIPEVAAYYIEQTAYLKPLMGASLPVGLIHGDVFTDNTIFQGDRLLALIDFEGACTEQLLYDVAITINGFCFRGQELDLELTQVFLQTYEKGRRLTSEERELIPAYIQYTAHAMMAWHINSYLERPGKDPKYLRRIRQLIERVQGVRKAIPVY